MNPMEEALDLKENPLPDLIIVEPLTYIGKLDQQIDLLQKEIVDLQEKREETLNFVIKNNIEEDENYKLDKKIRNTRILDIDRFKEVFPNAYELACSIERKQLESEIENIGKKLKIGVIDKLVPPARLSAAGVITISESVSYRVMKK